MPNPTHFFIDTSSLQRLKFNFKGPVLAAFLAASKQAGLTIVIPHPTEREILRHLSDASTLAISHVQKGRREAPFLPLPVLDGSAASKLAGTAWQQFVRGFGKVARLNYDLLDVRKVMFWYERQTPPFGSGKKKHEFPDAFAMAMLEAYVAHEGCKLAVVSQDGGFAEACQRSTSLLYFEQVPQLTELLLAKDQRLGEAKEAVAANLPVLEQAVLEALDDAWVLHSDHDITIHSVEFGITELRKVAVVGLGHGECSLAFDIVTGLTAKVTYPEQQGDGWGQASCELEEFPELSATAKVKLSAGEFKVLRVTLADPEILLTVRPGEDQW